jgi:hypothetical protein
VVQQGAVARRLALRGGGVVLGERAAQAVAEEVAGEVVDGAHPRRLGVGGKRRRLVL